MQKNKRREGHLPEGSQRGCRSSSRPQAPSRSDKAQDGGTGRGQGTDSLTVVSSPAVLGSREPLSPQIKAETVPQDSDQGLQAKGPPPLRAWTSSPSVRGSDTHAGRPGP